VNLGLVMLFGLQHSIMARPAFKRRWTQIVPREMERSTFVLATVVALGLLMWQWRPLGGVIWQVEDTTARAVLYGAFAFGWGLVLVATFLINHFDLFGLRQVWFALRGKAYAPVRFAKPWLYRQVRHPLYLGFLIAFWCTPVMTVTHLVLAGALTAYILFAIRLEERDLRRIHTRCTGSRYRC
jgi:protein-S-isoprenylcysteine O-methyltransferase Ste14